MTPIISIIAGWTADRLLGDPERLPHPVVWFGKAIAAGERRLNKGSHRKAKGAAMSVSLTIITFAVTAAIIMLAEMLSHTVAIIIQALLIFYCLAGQTLIKEVKGVFEALDRSLDCGRKQVSRIVGRDTSQLTDNEVRKAALETLAENLSDGVIAPVFWLIVLGVPGMMAYKMINTLDSMIATAPSAIKTSVWWRRAPTTQPTFCRHGSRHCSWCSCPEGLRCSSLLQQTDASTQVRTAAIPKQPWQEY